MLKKMTLLAMSIGALVAFAVPATAGAAELKGAQVGDPISASSINTEMRIPGGAIMKCAHVVFHGVVSYDSGGVVEVEGVGGDVMNGCDINGQPMILNPTFEAFYLEGTEGEIAFSAELLTEAGFCPMMSTTSSLGWISEASWLHFETVVVPGKAGCMGGEMHGDFQLESNGQPVTIN